jgi:glutaredoxin
LNAQVLGISVDHVPCLKAWADSLGGITFPLLSDFWPHGAVSEQYGVLRAKDGHSERALFVIDRQGVIRYVDIHDIGHQPDNAVLFDVLASLNPGQPRQWVTPVALPHGGIVMYCTRWCTDCKRARKWMDARGLAYTEVDISATNTATQQVRAWANGSLITPTFDIDGTIVVDFDEAQFAQTLKAKGML